MKEITNRISVEHETRLFVLDWPYFFPRGRVEDPEGEIRIDIEHVRIGRFGFLPNQIAKMFLAQVSRFKPDVVYIGDGNWYKLYLLDIMSRNFPTIVRFYSYEILCPRNIMLWNKQTYFCKNDYFQDPQKCVRCTFWSLSGMMNLEMWLSLSYLKNSYEWACKALGRCRTLAVNNSLAVQRLKPVNTNTKIIHSGVDCDVFTPSGGTSNTRPTILAVGRFDAEYKGIGTVLEACGKLWDEGARFTLLTIGGRGKVPSLPFVENIPWVDYKNIQEYYRRADMVVVPSLWQEAFGMVAVEAMACGKAVIASKVGGLQEIIKHAETGLLVEPGDINAWKEAIRRLVENGEEREAMGKRGRELAIEKYDWPRIVELYKWDELI